MNKSILRRTAAALTMALCGLAITIVAATPAYAAATSREQATSANNSTATKSVTAPCPVGKSVLGGGGSISGGGGNVHFTRLNAVGGGTNGFVAAASENGNYANNWSITAYAICGTAANLQYLSAITASNTDNHKDAQRNCPTGSLPLHFGVQITGSIGDVIIGAFGSTVGWNGSKVSATRAPGGSTANWALTAHVVCADEDLAGRQMLWGDVVPADSNPKGKTVGCPAGKTLHGGGAVIVSSSGEVLQRAVTPSSTLGGITVNFIEDADGAAHNWWVRVYAICAT